MVFHKARALQLADKSVAQGKTANAIKQYQEILDNDPSDVSLLNTIGDLYIRDRNITEGLRHFHRLAEAYVREGFNLKAIAIYRKISKVDPNSIDPFLKLAELYQLQGLSREAREQYVQAADFFKKRKQIDRAMEVFRKLVQLDPENINFRNRLAAECEEAGRWELAALAYSEAAEILLRRDDREAAETALDKAAGLDPGNSRIQILRARVNIMLGRYEQAEQIIAASPELQSEAAGQRILLDAYLGSQKLPEALTLAQQVFRADPADFAPIGSVCAVLLEKGHVDDAFSLLDSVAEPLIAHDNAGPLLEALRRIWTAAPQRIPTLELIHRICERTANEGTLPEVLEALGRAYDMAGDLERAEAAYLKLRQREPENQKHRGLLNAVQQKLGRESQPGSFSSNHVALAAGGVEGSPWQPPQADARQEAMVKEALENSDLFARYNLPEKAIAELERVLQAYPDQIEIHRRILEISRKGFPEKGSVAAAQLARIFTEHGDTETAGKYQAISSAEGALDQIPLPGPPYGEPVEQLTTPSSSSPQMPTVDGSGTVSPTVAAVSDRRPLGSNDSAAVRDCRYSVEFPVSAAAPTEPGAKEPSGPVEIPFDLGPAQVSTEPPAASLSLPGQVSELDLSGELEALAATDIESPAAPISEAEPAAFSPTDLPPPTGTAPLAEAPTSRITGTPALREEPFPVPLLDGAPLPGLDDGATLHELEDSKVEVEFYLENDFVDEARQTVVALEQKYPGSPFVAELRQLLEHANEAAHAAPEDMGLPADHAGVAEPEIELLSEPELMAEDPAQEDWEIPSIYADAAPPAPESAKTAAAPPTGTLAPESEFSIEPPAAHRPPITEPIGPAGGPTAILDDLAADLASTVDSLAPSAASSASGLVGAAAPPASPKVAADLSGLLEEMDGADAAAAKKKDDPQTHYNLGVAFREMGLLDESIGEFQKVVKGSGKGNFPPNFLAACSLLAICFMDKKMPAIAVRWYLRALESPNLDEEATLALQYDLGVAYQLAGDSRKALERYTDVYSQNIDFRDVAEKVRELQHKA